MSTFPNLQTSEEVLKALDVSLEDLTNEQKTLLMNLSEEIKDPRNMSPDQAMKIVKALNLDIETLQRKARALRAKTVSNRVKIGVNEPCPCASGKKYKKCCKLKDDTKSTLQ
jgi:uncharacterized protein YecA (UPF0149 family)